MSERTFRVGRVIPFLKKLKNTAFFPIQQRAICGDSDFYMCICGRFVALELKKSWGERPRVLQSHKLSQIESSGGVAIVAYPENWEDVKKHLTGLSRMENQWKKMLA